MGFPLWVLISLIKEFKGRLRSLRTILLNFKDKSNRMGKMQIQEAAARRRGVRGGEGEKVVSFRCGGQKQ